MTWAGPSTPERRAQWRRAQRAVALTHHPDRGGDLLQYLDQLAVVDQLFGAAAAPNGRSATSSATPRPWPAVRMALIRKGLRRSARCARAIQTRLPRRIPGARRYIDL